MALSAAARASLRDVLERGTSGSASPTMWSHTATTPTSSGLASLQSLCSHCHESRKKFLEHCGFDNTIGADGMPVEPRHPEIASEPAGHGLPLSKCEAYNRVYGRPLRIELRSSHRFSAVGAGRWLRMFGWARRPSSRA